MEALSSNITVYANSSLERFLSNLLDQLSKDTPVRARLVREYDIKDLQETRERIRRILTSSVPMGC
jgi:hypothetical protein